LKGKATSFFKRVFQNNFDLHIIVKHKGQLLTSFRDCENYYQKTLIRTRTNYLKHE